MRIEPRAQGFNNYVKQGTPASALREFQSVVCPENILKCDRLYSKVGTKQSATPEAQGHNAHLNIQLWLNRKLSIADALSVIWTNSAWLEEDYS